MQKNHKIILAVVGVVIVLLIVVKTLLSGLGSISTMNDALESGKEITNASFELVINTSEEVNEKNTAYPTITISGYKTEKNDVIKLTAINDNNEVIESGEMILITESGMYIEKSAFAFFTSQLFGFQTNEDDTQKTEWVLVTKNFKEDTKSSYSNFVNLLADITAAGVGDIKTQTDENAYIMNANDPETVTLVYNNLLTYVETNKTELATFITNIISTLDLNSKSDLCKRLANTEETLTDAEYTNKILDNISKKLKSLADNSKNGEQYIECSVAYTKNVDEPDVFSESISLKYKKDEKMMTTNISFSLNEAEGIDIKDINLESSSATQSKNAIDAICSEIAKYDFSNLLALDCEEKETCEFDVVVKDNIIVCTDKNTIYPRKVIYSTNNNKISEVVAFVVSDNDIINAAFDDFYVSAGYTKYTIEINKGEIDVNNISKQALAEIQSTLENTTFAKEPKTIQVYIATDNIIQNINNSLTTIDNFVLALKD